MMSSEFPAFVIGDALVKARCIYCSSGVFYSISKSSQDHTVMPAFCDSSAVGLLNAASAYVYSNNHFLSLFACFSVKFFFKYFFLFRIKEFIY